MLSSNDSSKRNSANVAQQKLLKKDNFQTSTMASTTIGSNDSPPSLDSAIINKAAKEIAEILNELEVFSKASGMHAFESEVDQLRNFGGDKNLLLALVKGPKTQVEEFCSILNNNAVYAGLILSATIPLAMAPPVSIQSLSNTDSYKLWYFIGMMSSILLNVMGVLLAVILFYCKAQLLRDSDCVGFLQVVNKFDKFSGWCMFFGLVFLLVAALPMAYVTYGAAAMAILLSVNVVVLVTFLVVVFRADARNVEYFFMKRDKKQFSLYSLYSRWVSGYAGKYDDPYDPNIAIRLHRTFCELSKAFTTLDRDKNGVVNTDDCYAAEMRSQQSSHTSENSNQA